MNIRERIKQVLSHKTSRKFTTLFVGTAVSAAAGLAQAAPAAPVSPLMLNESIDDTSMTVVWQKPSSYSSITSYKVYVNGSLKGSTSNGPTGKPNLYYHITGLTANTVYANLIKVSSVDGTGESAQVVAGASSSGSGTQCASGSCKTMATQPVVYVHSYSGATAVQQAIDACASNGKVVIQSGETYTSGAVFFKHGSTTKNNCTLQVDGTLNADTNAASYPYTNDRFPSYGTGGNYGSVHYPTNHMGLLNSCDTTSCAVSNIRIVGSGHVTGGAYVSGALTTLGNNMASAHGDSSRADLVNMAGVTGLYMRGVTFQDPPMHILFVARSSNVSVETVTSNSYRGADSSIHNGDGIDLATTSSAYVFGSSFDDGDDCINLNAGSNLPGVTEARADSNIRVFDNTTHHGHGGVVFGSFTAAWIKSVTAEDNKFDGTDVGLRFKTGTNRGGGAGGTSSMSDGVLCRDNQINNIKSTGIEMTGSYPDSTGYASAGVGYFRWITISNLTGSVASGAYAIKIDGNASPRHTNLTFSNVNITGSGGKGISVYQVSNSTFTNVTAASGTFYYEPGSYADTFSSCSPAPTAK